MSAQAYTHTDEVSSEPSGKCYREFYQITVVDGGDRALARPMGRPDNYRINVNEESYRALDRRHWIIMPSAPDSKAYYLVDMKNELVADIFKTSNLASKATFTGDDDHTFQLRDLTSGRVIALNPEGLRKVLTLRHGKNVVFTVINPEEPQAFTLTSPMA